MTKNDYLLLTDHVMNGPVREDQLAYEGKLPRGVATRVESALRAHALASLFTVANVLPGDTPEQAASKRSAAREANAAVIQNMLSA